MHMTGAVLLGFTGDATATDRSRATADSAGPDAMTLSDCDLDLVCAPND